MLLDCLGELARDNGEKDVAPDIFDLCVSWLLRELVQFAKEKERSIENVISGGFCRELLCDLISHSIKK